MKDTLSLLELQGMIASCAIENREHDKAYRIVSKLIDDFGPFRRISWKLFEKLVY